jgi:hypothetical protein
MFEVPVRLGERLCGYRPEAPLPVEWTILEPIGRKPSRSPDLCLPDIFRSELLPQLEGLGWTLAAGDPEFRGRAWDVTRVVHGRRQWLSFLWREDRFGPSFETLFVVFDGPAWESTNLVMGSVRREGAAATRRPRTFWSRLLGRAGAVESTPSDDRIAQLASRAREDFAALDRFLISGEPEAGIEVRFGSAEPLRAIST